jgi:3-hydroxyacyl-CoA dehydrogenase
VIADAVGDADVVIEAAPEKIDLKLALFKEAEAARPRTPSSRRTPRR